MKRLNPIIISSLLIIFLAFFLSRVITTGSTQVLIGSLIGFLGLFISFLNPTAGITILIFSMLLSPEIKVAQVPGRVVAIRYDDILLISIALGILARNAIIKGETGILPKTPLNSSILIYILFFLISTIKGIIAGNANPTKAFFYALKYFEFFLLFFIVSINIKSEKQIKIFLIAALLTCIIVCIYGYTQIGKVVRIGAPFDIEGAEPASLGGYLLIALGVFSGLLIYARTFSMKLFYSLLIIFTIPPFLNTFSRASYVGFIIMFLGFIIFAKRMKLILLSLFILGILFYPLIIPTAVISRVQETFAEQGRYSAVFMGTRLDMSAIDRLYSYVYVTKDKLPEHFFIGHGITGGGFIDGQYFLILVELGTLGFIAFLWLIIKIFKSVIKVYKNLQVNHWAKGLPLGFLAALSGILAQAITTNSFIIVRIMEPFWFLCAIILSFSRIFPNQSENFKVSHLL